MCEFRAALCRAVWRGPRSISIGRAMIGKRATTYLALAILELENCPTLIDEEAHNIEVTARCGQMEGGDERVRVKRSISQGEGRRLKGSVMDLISTVHTR